MGSPKDERERDEDEELHEVEISKPFYLGVYEVTQGQYEKVMGKGKDAVKGLDTTNFPVEQVSWHDAKEFCAMLSALPKEKATDRVYRLPIQTRRPQGAMSGSNLRGRFLPCERLRATRPARQRR
jgi:formylglycine-generating enzyme required for sulfatase activity